MLFYLLYKEGSGMWGKKEYSIPSVIFSSICSQVLGYLGLKPLIFLLMVAFYSAMYGADQAKLAERMKRYMT